MMDDIFGDMINECIIIVYMDDIFIFAPVDTAQSVMTRVRVTSDDDSWSYKRLSTSTSTNMYNER